MGTSILQTKLLTEGSSGSHCQGRANGAGKTRGVRLGGTGGGGRASLSRAFLLNLGASVHRGRRELSTGSIGFILRALPQPEGNRRSWPLIEI